MSSRALSFSSARVPPGRRALRVLAIVLAVVLALALIWAAALAAVWGYAWLRLGPDDIPALQDERPVLGPAGASAPADATTLVVALTGPVDPTVLRPPELVGPVALVQVGGGRAEPAVLSLPGELMVTIDGLGEVSLAEVQREGGTDLLVRALADYSAVRIDHAVSLSIDALPELVDALGPLEVCGSAGCSSTTGEQLRQALATADDASLVRLVGDVSRALGRRIDARFVARSPLLARQVVEIVGAEVSTDVALRGTRLLEIAGALATPVRLDTDTVPLVVNPESGSIVPLSEPAMVRFQHLRDGTSLRVGAEDVGTEALEAEMIASAKVAVLNGAGIDGLAGRVRIELETAGFNVVGTGNARSFDRTDTVINYLADEPAIDFAAQRLSEALGGAALEPFGRRPEFEGEEVDLLVTVGADRQG